MMARAVCRFRGAHLNLVACDLGCQPLANGLVPMDAPDAPDPRFPLCVMIWESCLLEQPRQTVDPAAMFGEYSYLSSVSSVWREHAARFAGMAATRFIGAWGGRFVIASPGPRVIVA